jgi:hypothetical protein
MGKEAMAPCSSLTRRSQVEFENGPVKLAFGMGKRREGPINTGIEARS